MNPQKSWPQHTLIQKRNRGRHTGGALLSCKKGRPDRNLRDLRADEDEQTGGSGLSETVDRPGLRKNRRKKHLRLPHRAGTDPGRGMPPPP